MYVNGNEINLRRYINDKSETRDMKHKKILATQTTLVGSHWDTSEWTHFYRYFDKDSALTTGQNTC